MAYCRAPFRGSLGLSFGMLRGLSEDLLFGLRLLALAGAARGQELCCCYLCGGYAYTAPKSFS